MWKNRDEEVSSLNGRNKLARKQETTRINNERKLSRGDEKVKSMRAQEAKRAVGKYALKFGTLYCDFGGTCKARHVFEVP